MPVHGRMSEHDARTERDRLLRRTAELNAATLQLAGRKPFDAAAHAKLCAELDAHGLELAAYRARQASAMPHTEPSDAALPTAEPRSGLNDGNHGAPGGEAGGA